MVLGRFLDLVTTEQVRVATTFLGVLPGVFALVRPGGCPVAGVEVFALVASADRAA
jgi:hypothetical protein